MECVRNHRIECPGHDSGECCLNNDARFVNCETCQTEGRILTNDGGPDDVDHGVCPACNGDRVVEVEAETIFLEDLEDAYG